jgi:hypothetical protein
VVRWCGGEGEGSGGRWVGQAAAAAVAAGRRGWRGGAVRSLDYRARNPSTLSLSPRPSL